MAIGFSKNSCKASIFCLAAIVFGIGTAWIDVSAVAVGQTPLTVKATVSNVAGTAQITVVP